MSNSPDRPVLLRIENVTKRFGDAVAVRSVSLDIAAGEFFSLLGPSGCGKTTLLRMIAGFEVPNEGRILLDGQDIALLPPHRRPVNTVFQSYALFPHLSVRDNVAFGLHRQHVKDPELSARVTESLALVRLEGYGARMPHQLSGGQRQRVALARALVMRPRVLLLDEPLGALDHQLRLQMQVELKDLQRSCGITFLFVTHDQPEALTMSDRIAVLSQGVVEQHGPSREVYEQPRTDFVARFMGASNLLPGKVTEVVGGQMTVALEAGPALTLPATEGVGATVRVMLRPEWLFLRKEALDEPGWLSWPVEVLDRHYQGAVTRWNVRGLGSEPLEVAGTPLAGGGGDRLISEDVSPGQRASLVWRAGAGVVLRMGGAA